MSVSIALVYTDTWLGYVSVGFESDGSSCFEVHTQSDDGNTPHCPPSGDWPTYTTTCDEELGYTLTVGPCPEGSSTSSSGGGSSSSSTPSSSSSSQSSSSSTSSSTSSSGGSSSSTSGGSSSSGGDGSSSSDGHTSSSSTGGSSSSGVSSSTSGGSSSSTGGSSSSDGGGSSSSSACYPTDCVSWGECTAADGTPITWCVEDNCGNHFDAPPNCGGSSGQGMGDF